MQPWHIKILELEQTALGQLDEFIAQHKLGVLVTLIYLVLAIGIGLIVLLCRGQRQNPQRGRTHVPPIIIIETPAPPPPPADTFDPFPPPHHYRNCDCNDHYPD